MSAPQNDGGGGPGPGGRPPAPSAGQAAVALSVEDGIAEAEFFIHQGLLDEGIQSLEELRRTVGNDPRITGRLNAALSLRRSQQAAAAPAPAPSPPATSTDPSAPRAGGLPLDLRPAALPDTGPTLTPLERLKQIGGRKGPTPAAGPTSPAPRPAPDESDIAALPPPPMAMEAPALPDLHPVFEAEAAPPPAVQPGRGQALPRPAAPPPPPVAPDAHAAPPTPPVAPDASGAPSPPVAPDASGAPSPPVAPDAHAAPPTPPVAPDASGAPSPPVAPDAHAAPPTPPVAPLPDLPPVLGGPTRERTRLQLPPAPRRNRALIIAAIVLGLAVVVVVGLLVRRAGRREDGPDNARRPSPGAAMTAGPIAAAPPPERRRSPSSSGPDADRPRTRPPATPGTEPGTRPTIPGDPRPATPGTEPGTRPATPAPPPDAPPLRRTATPTGQVRLRLSIGPDKATPVVIFRRQSTWGKVFESPPLAPTGKKELVRIKAKGFHTHEFWVTLDRTVEQTIVLKPSSSRMKLFDLGDRWPDKRP